MNVSRDCVCAACGAEGVTKQPDPVWCPDCIEKQVKPGQKVAYCRVCGAMGIEDENDPAPSVCPDCLGDALIEAIRLEEGQ